VHALLTTNGKLIQVKLRGTVARNITPEIRGSGIEEANLSGEKEGFLLLEVTRDAW